MVEGKEMNARNWGGLDGKKERIMNMCWMMGAKNKLRSGKETKRSLKKGLQQTRGNPFHYITEHQRGGWWHLYEFMNTNNLLNKYFTLLR